MTKEKKHTIILGIDPGTRITGYGLISTDHHSFEALDYGCIRPPAKLPLSDRYLAIFESIDHILDSYPVDAVTIENQFVSRNAQSALKLGMAKGVAMLAASKRRIPIFEYAPKQAKLSVVGSGSASKEQVQKMVQALLNLPEPPHPEDAADALALAICHINHSSAAALIRN